MMILLMPISGDLAGAGSPLGSSRLAPPIPAASPPRFFSPTSLRYGRCGFLAAVWLPRKKVCPKKKEIGRTDFNLRFLRKY